MKAPQKIRLGSSLYSPPRHERVVTSLPRHLLSLSLDVNANISCWFHREVSELKHIFDKNIRNGTGSDEIVDSHVGKVDKWTMTVFRILYKSTLMQDDSLHSIESIKLCELFVTTRFMSQEWLSVFTKQN